MLEINQIKARKIGASRLNLMPLGGVTAIKLRNKKPKK